MAQFELGERLRDAISGIEGVAVGRYQYLTGCTRYGLEVIKDDGDLIELAFDVTRLESLGVKVELPLQKGLKAASEPRGAG